MTLKRTASLDAVRALINRSLSDLEIWDIASDENTNDDERKAAKMLICLDRIEAPEKEATP